MYGLDNLAIQVAGTFYEALRGSQAFSIAMMLLMGSGT